MTLTTTEMNVVTRSHFMADNGKAIDIYYNTSAMLERKLKQKEGFYELVSGGVNAEFPLKYDLAPGGVFTRMGTLSSSDKQTISSVNFEWKSYEGSGFIAWQDELVNAGDEEKLIDIIREKADAAAQKPRYDIAKNIYSSAGDSDPDIQGFSSMCDNTVTTNYGGKSENDIVASDGTKPWAGTTVTTSQPITLANWRALAKVARWKDGMDGKPTISTMHNDLFVSLKDQLQPLQTLTEDMRTTAAGFENIKIDGVTVIPDDFLQSTECVIANDKYFGFKVMKKGNFVVVPWQETQIANIMAKVMRVLFMGAMGCTNRKAHVMHTGFTA